MIRYDHNILEAFQVEAALLDRQATLTAREAEMPAGVERDFVSTGLYYTGKALATLQTALYGEDEPEWLHEDPIYLAAWEEDRGVVVMTGTRA